MRLESQKRKKMKSPCAWKSNAGRFSNQNLSWIHVMTFIPYLLTTYHSFKELLMKGRIINMAEAKKA